MQQARNDFLMTDLLAICCFLQTISPSPLFSVPLAISCFHHNANFSRKFAAWLLRGVTEYFRFLLLEKCSSKSNPEHVQ